MRNIGRKTAMNIEKKLYQWDTEQKLTGCTGLYVDFPIGNEVYRVETADGTCIIPDELLQTSGSHKVYECMTNNTIRSFAFSVTPRLKPPDYVYTPTERLTFEGLVQRVDDAVADMIRRAESGEFDGHTPVKGTDYFTTGEIQQIQNEVSSGAIGEFKSVVDTETETFNTNAESKLTTYNENDVAKTGAYNTNASNKVTEYNSNAENKTAEFDTHTEQIQADISELKSDINNIINTTIKSDVKKILGKYINKNTNIYDETGAFYTEPFYVEKNTKLIIFAKGYQTNVAILCSCDENGNNRTLLVESTDSTEKEYCYTVPNDSYMVVCSYDIPNFYIEITISMLNKTNEKVDKLSVEVEKINRKVNVYPNYMMMFERIGGIGDSLMSGEIQVPNYEQGTSTFTDVLSQSWLSHIARKTNAEYKCYSRGGHTCKSWLNSPLYSQLATDPKANAYFIGLLTNDKLTSAGYDIGTINDVAGNDSFVGYYKQIIEYVRTQAPNAIIFCMSGYDNDEKDVQYSAMVKDICDLYDNCFYIDFANNTDMYISTNKNAMKYVTGSHYTTLGYIKISEEIMNIVNGVIDSNYEKFRYFSLNYI